MSRDLAKLVEQGFSTTSLSAYGRIIDGTVTDTTNDRWKSAAMNLALTIDGQTVSAKRWKGIVVGGR